MSNTETTRTTHPNLVAALAAAQNEIPTITKGDTANVRMKNGGTYSYQYATLADIHTAVLPVLARHGLAWITMPTLRDNGTYVLACELAHTSGETRTCEMPLPSAASAQELGSAITYMRRYAICAVCGIATDEDDDGAAATEAHERNTTQQPRKARTKRQPRQAKTPAKMPTADVLNIACAASTPEQIREIWSKANLDDPIAAPTYETLSQYGITGETVREVLAAIAQHIKDTGGPVVPLWPDNADQA